MAPTHRGDGTGLDPKGFAEVRKGDGTVLWSSEPAPDSAILHADATELDLADGDGVTTWPDLSGGGNDLTGSNPEFKTDILDGNPVVRFDDVDDVLDVTFDNSISQPNYIIGVIYFRSVDSDLLSIYDGVKSDERHTLQTDATGERNWRIYAGNSIDGGGADSDPHIFTAIYDGTNSELRIDGSTEMSGDAGTHDLGGLTLNRRFDGSNHGGIDAAEIIVGDGALSSEERDKQEQRLSDKWGITI